MSYLRGINLFNDSGIQNKNEASHDKNNGEGKKKKKKENPRLSHMVKDVCEASSLRVVCLFQSRRRAAEAMCLRDAYALSSELGESPDSTAPFSKIHE